MFQCISCNILVSKRIYYGVHDVSLTYYFVHFVMYSESCMDVKTAISNSKSEILQKKISDCNGDKKKHLARTEQANYVTKV